MHAAISNCSSLFLSRPLVSRTITSLGYWNTLYIYMCVHRTEGRDVRTHHGLGAHINRRLDLFSFLPQATRPPDTSHPHTTAMNYPYLTGIPNTCQSPYQQQPAHPAPTMVTANEYVPLAQNAGTPQAQVQQQPAPLPPTMVEVNPYVFGTIIEVDARLRVVYIKSFAGEKAVAIEFTDDDLFDRLLRYNFNYHGDNVVTYYSSGRWGLLAADCHIFNYKWYRIRPRIWPHPRSRRDRTHH